MHLIRAFRDGLFGRRVPWRLPGFVVLLLVLALAGGTIQSPTGSDVVLRDGPHVDDSSAVPARKGPPKLESSLVRLADAYESGGSAEAASVARSHDLHLDGEMVRVMVEALPGRAADVAAASQAAGAQVERSTGDLVQLLAPVTALEDLAAIDDVQLVRRPAIFVPAGLANMGLASNGTVSEGVDLSGAGAWHDAGYTGDGVKVAVLDTSFREYGHLLGTDLPSDVVTRSFRADGLIGAEPGLWGLHGTALAEIVYDMAPGVELYLVAFDTEAELRDAVHWLITEDVDIICWGMGYYQTGPGDGTGWVNDLVDDAADSGILWVTAAGNAAQEHWRGPFTDRDGNDVHEWVVDDEDNTLYAFEDDFMVVFLVWDDPFGAACNDYDLWVLDDEGYPLYWSLDYQRCSGDPTETIVFWAPYTGDYSIVIDRWSASQSVDFDVFFYPLWSVLELPILEYYSTPRSLIPPADNAEAMTVGAVDWEWPDSIQDYSSRGPTRDGRVKPDLVAFDEVSTWSYGEGEFAGTSASSPHAAGAAALVKEAYSGYSPAQIKSFLKDRAVYLGPQSLIFGAGRLNLGAPPDGADGPTPSPTPPVSGHLENCPQAGKWSLATWGGSTGVPIGDALATCSNPVAAAYALDPQTQGWSRYLEGHPEISDLHSLAEMQGVIALGSGTGAASVAAAAMPGQQGTDQLLNCPQPGKWAIAVWSGQNGMDTGQALATCDDTVDLAYWIDPQTQGWLAYVLCRPEVSSLDTIDSLQAIIVRGRPLVDVGLSQQCYQSWTTAAGLETMIYLSGLEGSSTADLEAQLQTEGAFIQANCLSSTVVPVPEPTSDTQVLLGAATSAASIMTGLVTAADMQGVPHTYLSQHLAQLNAFIQSSCQ